MSQVFLALRAEGSAHETIPARPLGGAPRTGLVGIDTVTRNKAQYIHTFFIGSAVERCLLFHVRATVVALGDASQEGLRPQRRHERRYEAIASGR